jgi:hypothetical protein
LVARLRAMLSPDWTLPPALAWTQIVMDSPDVREAAVAIGLGEKET